MTIQEAIDNIQLDRMAGDITDEQADAAIEKIQDKADQEAFYSDWVQLQ